ncbi:hypothetical protein D9M69_709990 [compost metagenome]
MVLRRDMKELWIMLSKYGKSTPVFFGLRKRITTQLSSMVGISLEMKGLEVSTAGTR